MQPGSDRSSKAGTSLGDMLAPLTNPLPPVEERAVMPSGFRAAGLACGIKPSGRPDLALVATLDGPAAAAAVFTRNAIVAAPIELSRAHLNATEIGGGGRFGWADALVATAGSANAATGPQGDADQEELGRAVAALLNTEPERTLALSTGVIGVRLPMPQVCDGLARLVALLEPTNAGLEAFATAIMTTDTKIKLATTSVELPGPDGKGVMVTVSGIAKGVGMIHPRMATMLSLILTDASASPTTLFGLLSPAVQRTWNQTSVDGDTSTNDTVFLLASGASKAHAVATASPEAAVLGRAVESVARSLAR
ncbi:MAG TPA: bifunctional ornithine acetyltransferase/N-acetylglutamate synthase, partial [Candidatus Limnocylindrales bacterium]|nr:bifunctional ornithine acetyltransferase/N-acetylglutamate synthase [Candidatus Limnocylindrales bacterium]